MEYDADRPAHFLRRVALVAISFLIVPYEIVPTRQAEVDEAATSVHLDVRTLREIEQVYSTQVEEMPMNVGYLEIPDGRLLWNRHHGTW